MDAGTDDGTLPYEARRARRTIVGVLSVGLLLVSGCSGDAGVSSGTASANASTAQSTSEPTSAPTAPTSTASATTAAPTTSAASPPPTTTTPVTTSTVPLARASGFAASFAIPDSATPSAFGAALLAPANGRGLLLFATAQEALGQRYTPTVWESPDGSDWTRVDDAALASGAMSFVNAATWVGNVLTVGGSFNDRTGSHAAVWLATDGRRFAQPEDVFNGATGVVNAVTGGPQGVLAAGRIDEAGATRAVVARRDLAGRWTTTELPGPSAAVSGMTADGSTIVVTGSSRPVSITESAAWVSTDGGVTFAAADTAALMSPIGTRLGGVTTWTSGFVSVACIAGPDGLTVGLATSADGASWRTLPITVDDVNGNAYPYLGTDCTSITSTGGGVLFGVNDLDSAIIAVDTAGTGRAAYAPRPSGHISSDPPLVAPGPAGVVAVSVQSRGLAAGVDNGDGSIEATATGLPVGAPTVFDVTIGPVIAGTAATVSIFPVVTEQANGAYRWGPRQSWLQSPELKNWAVTAAFDNTDIDHVASTGTLDVGFSAGADPADADDGGPIFGIVAWSRGPDEQWQSHGIVLGGPGGQAVDDLRIFEGGFVAVGASTTRDPSTGAQSSTPVALTSPDGLNWTAENVPATQPSTRLNRVCPVAGGNVVAFGTATGDSTSEFAAVRTTDGVWAPVDATAFGGFVGNVECASTADRSLVVFTDGDLPAMISTTDGATLTRVDLSDPAFVGSRFDGVVAVGRRFVIGGVSRLRGADRPQLWISDDGVRADPLIVDGWAAVADEIVNGVALAFGHVVVSGTRNGQPTVWAVPESAISKV